MAPTAVAILCALELLGRSLSRMPTIKVIAAPPAGHSHNAEGFVVRNPDAIYLIASTAAFQDAQHGLTQARGREGCRRLAGVIAHEEAHLRHGADEEGAYLAQLTTLAALGADSALLNSVRQSMRFVISAQKAEVRRPRHNAARAP